MTSVSSTIDAVDSGHGRAVALLPWILLLMGLCVMYMPTAWGLFQGPITPEEEHGPIVLFVSLWLFYSKWTEVMAAREESPSTVLGWLVFILGLLFYVIGHSQGIVSIDIGSGILILLGLGLIVLGKKAIKIVWFPFFFMVFLIPFPAGIVDVVTMPVKQAVSYVVDHMLYALGYPIARLGVILHIGQYKLLVADACAGLQTLFALESLGLLYLNVVRHESLLRNTILAILIIPISFIANVIRVTVLVLVTYHFGDEAGQGFVHKFAGMVLFLSALILIITVDSLARTLFASKKIEP